MNKVFKVIWNEARNAYVVVSEIAKNHGSKSCSTKKLLAMLIATGVMTLQALTCWRQSLVELTRLSLNMLRLLIQHILCIVEIKRPLMGMSISMMQPINIGCVKAINWWLKKMAPCIHRFPTMPNLLM